MKHLSSSLSKMIFVRLHHSSSENLKATAAASSYEHSKPFESIENARAGVEDELLLDLEGTLLKSTSCFPHFMLVALEAGSPLRALLLLLSVPVAWILRQLFSSVIEIRIFAFIALAGLKVSAVECVSRAVLAKFFLEDMHPETFRIFKACGRRHVLTSIPVIMVEAFTKHYLEAEHVIGTEIEVSSGGYCTGCLKMAVGEANKTRLAKEFLKDRAPQIGIGNEEGDSSFLSLCKRSYIVPSSSSSGKKYAAVSKKDYIKPLVFHDGRLVHSPTPLHCLVILLWLPIAIPLALIRVALGLSLPKSLALPVEALLGVSVRVKGTPPASPTGPGGGVLFVCTHRSLLDPVFISFARMRNVTTVTYSVSRLSEVLSPIRTARLTRGREHDSKTMASLLREGDLAVCPEGTTSREPFLLRFSPLFAELTDRIVPVSVTSRFTMFHATTARGWKCLDPLFFFMNPAPGYEVKFLQQIPAEETCFSGERPSHEVANQVQRLLADSLGYECTNLTRKDKYRMLVGTDGLVPASLSSLASLVSASSSSLASSSSRVCGKSLFKDRLLWLADRIDAAIRS